MDSILITGGTPLNGAIPIAGAKNACLTLMPATLLSDEGADDVEEYEDTDDESGELKN